MSIKKVKALLENGNNQQAKRELLIIIEASKDVAKQRRAKSLYLELANHHHQFSDQLQAILEHYPDSWNPTTLEHITTCLEYMRQMTIDTSNFLEQVNKDVDYKYMRRKKELLIKSGSLSYHYFESIFSLLSIHNTVAATALLRCLMELNINQKYMYLVQDNSNIDKLVVGELTHAIRTLKSQEKLDIIERNQKHAEWMRLLQKRLERRKIKRGGVSAGSLYSRAKQVDQATDEHMNEQEYLYFYTRFSDAIHGQTILLDSLTEGVSIAYPGVYKDYNLITLSASLSHLSILQAIEWRVYKSRRQTNNFFNRLDEFSEETEKYFGTNAD